MKERTEKRGVNEENVKRIKGEIDWALVDCMKAPSDIVVKIVMKTLDNAEREGRLNAQERLEACNYMRKEYGLTF